MSLNRDDLAKHGLACKGGWGKYHFCNWDKYHKKGNSNQLQARSSKKNQERLKDSFRECLAMVWATETPSKLYHCLSATTLKTRYTLEYIKGSTNQGKCEPRALGIRISAYGESHDEPKRHPFQGTGDGRA